MVLWIIGSLIGEFFTLMVGIAQSTTTNTTFIPFGNQYQKELFIVPVSPYQSVYKHFLAQGISSDVIQKIEQAREYIESFWGKLIVHPDQFSNEDKKSGAIRLPSPYLMPMIKGGLHARFFYWDSFFTSLPHIGTEREYLAIGAVENCAYLFEKYQIIPNQADIRFLHRSQPPVMTSMIMAIYKSFANRAVGDKKITKENTRWLRKYIAIAKKEYTWVWTSATRGSADEKHTYNHRRYAFTTLSNWGDRDLGAHHPSEYESGKDTTAEFAGRAGDYIPVDLNCFLLKYERDFKDAAEILGDDEEKMLWERKIQQRITEMNKYFWDEGTGYYYNYDVKAGKRDTFKTLSGFQALWCGLATTEQAAQMVNNLSWFESEHGLMTTSPRSNPPAFTDLNVEKLLEAGIPHRYLESIKYVLLPGQWTAPNIWSPTEMMTIFGLLQYGYTNHVARIMKKVLLSLADYFNQYNTMPEKRNGYTGGGGGDHTYPDKNGFGWTNAEFLTYLNLFDQMVGGPTSIDDVM